MRPEVFDNIRNRAFAGSLVRTLGAIVFIVLTMSASAAAQPPSTTENQFLGNSAYRLGPGDVIRITVLRQDLLTQDGIRIGNDGKIRLPMLSEPVIAACLTEADLASMLAERYRKYLLNPQVFVATREFNSNSVAVIGAVNSPGRFQLQRQVRLLEILSYVNGPAPNASHELQILRTVHRDICGEGSGTIASADAEQEPEIISLKVDDVLGGATEANPVLRGGDIVRIAQAEQKQAYVIGNVRAATTVNLRDPVSLSTAIAMSGGAVSGAQIEKIKITRQTPGSLNKSDIFVNLKAIRDGSQPDVLLQPNDIVDVPGPSGTKRFFKDILRTIVPVFTRAPVIIP